jgi:hypothetical protein
MIKRSEVDVIKSLAEPGYVFVSFEDRGSNHLLKSADFNSVETALVSLVFFLMHDLCEPQQFAVKAAFIPSLQLLSVAGRLSWVHP